MTNFSWGLLGPEQLGSERRTRTLGIGAAVREFNDLAVPGMGSVWYGKQLLHAVLGVAIAQAVRGEGEVIKNIETANAVEALGCWLGFKSNGWRTDERLRGSEKMKTNEEFSFKAARKPGFYVTQPMRMATLQPLLALGLAEAAGERFNSFRCTSLGHAFIAAACSGYSGLLGTLIDWAAGRPAKVTSSLGLRAVLSPLEPLTESAASFLRTRLDHGDGQDERRRQAVLAWVESIQREPLIAFSWADRPEQVSTEHWKDLQSGALFFRVRDSAIGVLDELELHIGNSGSQKWSLDAPLPLLVEQAITKLQRHARNFLAQGHRSLQEDVANTFCRECAEPNPSRLLSHLVDRDARVLRLRGRLVLPGAAFRYQPLTVAEAPFGSEDDGHDTLDGQLPAGISHRVAKMYRLNLDLKRELGDWLAGAMTADTVMEAV